MEKLKIDTAVFISGTGTNLLNLIKFSKNKNSPIKIKLVVSNNKNAKGLKFAKKYKIKFKIINFKNKIISERKLIKILRKNHIEFICLAGFLKILSKKFLKDFKNKIINIHPSLLPKYKGLNTHNRVLKNRELYTGCTVHFVTPILDSGKIIMQKKIRIFKKDDIISITKRVRKIEHEIYPKSIKKIFFNL